MKHSDINHSEKTFGIHFNNKKIALTERSIPINNSHSVMIVSAISTPINPNSSILSTALNTSRSKSAVLTKANSISTPTLNTNLMNQLTYISPNNNTIKLVNLSKCQHLQTATKDNCNITNNTINVQFVTPILNNSANAANDTKISKIDSTCINNSAVVLAGTSNQPMMTSNGSITCTRFVLHTSQAPILPHGTVTIIPQNSDINGNSNLIKNTRYTLTGTKQAPQTIRPITTCTTAVTSPPLIAGKQSLTKIPPSISLNNYQINMSDDNHATIAIQDLTVKRQTPVSKEPHRIVSKSTPLVTITSSNNIRLALTSNISNSKVNINPTKIQLISPKSRIRSGSPINFHKDGKCNDPMSGSKDENIENPGPDNPLGGCYSPTRKRARKQHLKAVTNKLQKLTSHGKYDTYAVINHINPTLTDTKSISTPISIAPTTTRIVQNKAPENPNSNIISLKNPIHIGASKISSIGSFYPSTNNGLVNSTNGKIGQVQIICQTSQSRPLQLSSVSQNVIISPTLGNRVMNISPQKVIHINQTKIDIVKPEKLSSELLNCIATVRNTVKNRKNDDHETVKLDVTEIKSEAKMESVVKYSLFPNKCHWNPRRTHFEKECDVRVKKSMSTGRHPTSEISEDSSRTNDSDIYDASWCLYKASTQFLKQKYFDEENLRNFHKLKEKFDIKPLTTDNGDEPVFQKICLSTLRFDPLPDQIDCGPWSEFTDPDQFGISADIISTHINTIIKNNPDTDCPEITNDPGPHHCTESCVFYLSKVPTLTQPPHIRRIIDLIEGLIVKERNIIEKESEINCQCLKLLASSDCGPILRSKNGNWLDKVQIPNGRRS